MKVVTIVGARPQFIKAAVLSRALRQAHQEILIHTGQHYDPQMSAVFFEELGIPAPNHNLGVGSGSHAAQTAAMLIGLEPILDRERPDWVIVYGDTNSTAAGALAASKLHIPVVHVEAGLRSFNRRMPEEINRVIADHLAQLLLCPSETARANLAREGLAERAEIIGDVMAEALEFAVTLAKTRPSALRSLGIEPGGYCLATIHRAENTDNPANLLAIIAGIGEGGQLTVFPVHPRTREVLNAAGARMPRNILVTDPLGYIDMVKVASSARLILTDSGGLQKEAYWLGVPCITLREETEWTETVASGWNMLAGAHAERIARAIRKMAVPPGIRQPLYVQGGGVRRAIELMVERQVRELTADAS